MGTVCCGALDCIYEDRYEEVSDDDYRNLCKAGEAEPVPVGVFDTLDEAVDWVEGMAIDGGD